MTIVVLSPHRDDAAFSLGLTIDGFLAAGHTVSVLNCFTQTAFAPYSDADNLHANDRLSFVSALRRREDQAWNKLLGGRLRFQDLDLLDAPLRLACSVEDVLTIATRPGDRAVARVAGAVAKLLRTAPANDLALVAPLAIGSHIDHRVVQQAVLDAVGDAAIPLAFYEDLPYAAREDGEATHLGSQDNVPAPDLEAVFTESPRADPASAVQRKTHLLQCYDSQVDSDAVRAMAEFALRYGGRERLWANAAWRAAGLGVAEQMDQ